jgi:hypothetical protein
LLLVLVAQRARLSLWTLQWATLVALELRQLLVQQPGCVQQMVLVVVVAQMPQVVRLVLAAL